MDTESKIPEERFEQLQRIDFLTKENYQSEFDKLSNLKKDMVRRKIKKMMKRRNR